MDDNKKPDDTTDKTAENVSKPPDSKKESDSSSDSESTKSDHSSGKEQPTQKVKKKRKKKKKKNKDKQNSDSEGEDNNDKHGNEGQPKAKPAVKAVLPLPRKHDALYTLTVALRIRPLSPEEKADGSFSIAYKLDERVKFKFSLYQTCSIHMVVVLRDADDVENKLPKIREKHFVFDRTLGPDATQKEVYDKSAKSLIAGLFDGFNATVFAYGATGAGKTYTMIGTSGKPGIMARSLDDVYKSVQNVDHGNEYEIVMSYLEIYNEQIKDLLIDDSGNLELREDVRGAIQVTGLTELRATSSRDVSRYLFAI